MTDTILTLPLPLPFGMGHVNAYLIQSEAGAVLIDTGGSNARKHLLGELERAGCTARSLKTIVLTHGDFDHIGNAAFLRSSFGARLAMHPDDQAMAEQGDMFAGRERPNPVVGALVPLLSGFRASDRFVPDLLLQDGDDLAPLGIGAVVVGLPGHSRGSIGILTHDRALICGDLLEATQEPRLNSLMDDRTAARASVARLQSLPIRRIYPGHGRSFQMTELRGLGGSPPD